MRIESLESRRVLATFLVTNTDPAGPGSLADAIAAASGNPGADQVHFDIPGPVGTVHTIEPTGGLILDDATTLDATTQPGYSGSPLIEISGIAAGATSGLIVQGDSNVVAGLSIHGFSGAGILIDGGSDNSVVSNYLGLRADGVTASSNTDGVRVIGDGNVIGGAGPATRNVISGNGRGIRISADSNRVSGNTIGLAADGLTAVSNDSQGILVEGGAIGNVIGTDGDGIGDAFEGNVISGNGLANTEEQIAITGDQNVVAGNIIGLAADGQTPLTNVSFGIQINGDDNVIGSNGDGISDDLERNVIAAMTQQAVYVFGGTSTFIAGNFIGVDVTGELDRGGDSFGIDISGTASGARIGRTPAGIVIGNVVSGHTGFNINSGPGAEIVGNRIGTNAAGTSAISATAPAFGISAGDGAVIGGSLLGEGNLISGHDNDGIVLNGTDNVTILGNLIGTDVTGTMAIPNRNGIGTNAGTTNLTIGGLESGARNLISDNDSHGIEIGSASDSIIVGNFIGTNRTGTAALPNQNGVYVTNGSQRTTIGGRSIAARNVISGNTARGIDLFNSGSSNVRDVVIQGNFIGTDASGRAAVPNASGIRSVVAITNVQIGGGYDPAVDDFLTGPGNVISGNALDGISLTGNQGDLTIQGNRVGTDVSGTFGLGNGFGAVAFGWGVRLGSIAMAPAIIGVDGDGITDATEGNLISGNSNFGIRVDSRTGGHVIAGNLIGTDVSGTAEIDSDTGIVLLSPGNLIGTNLDGVSDELEANIIGGSNRPGTSGIGIVDFETADGMSHAGNRIQGNFIGTDRSGTADLGADFNAGVNIQRVAGTIVGGLGPAGNVIANNRLGIFAFSNDEFGDAPEATTTILGNRYFNNELQAIRLGNSFPENDPLDGETNFPIIESAGLEAGVLNVSGFAPAGTTLEFFVATPEAGANSDFGEGRFSIGAAVEGSASDTDAGVGSYGPIVDGVTVSAAAVTENRFAFGLPIPVSLQNRLNDGSLITAAVVGLPASEFSPVKQVGQQLSSLPPAITLSESAITLQPGDRLQVDGSFYDPDSTSWTATVDYGDGSEPATLTIAADNSFVLDHVYSNSGDFDVVVSVTDNSLAASTITLPVSVGNAAPEVNYNRFTLTTPADEGQTVTLVGDFSDLEVADVHSIDIDWGDGTVDTNLPIPTGDRTFTASHVYLDDTNSDNGPSAVDVYRIVVTVSDQSGGRDATPLGYFLEEIRNVLPRDLDVQLSSTSITEGDSVSLSGALSIREFWTPIACESIGATVLRCRLLIWPPA